MALNFPDSPVLNEVYTDSVSGFSYQWNGTVWRSYTPTTTQNISIIDDISGSFNGSDQTFPLTISGSPFFPTNPQQLLITLNGSVKEPVVDYTVSSSNITFTTPPAGGLNFSGISFGLSIPLSTPGDSSVTPAKLSNGGPSWNTSGDLSISGNARVTGILTASSFSGNSSSSTYATSSGIATYSTSSGIATSVIGGISSITTLQVTGLSTFTNGPVFVGSTTATGTASQPLQVTGGAYVSGSVGIATTNPTERLHVVGNILASGTITQNSDESLKDNIQTISDALDKVIQLRGVEFDRKDIEGTPHQIGVIAQEVEKIIPEVVTTHTDGVKSVAYGNLVGLLIEAIKEQQEQINILKKEIERLK